MVQLAFTSFTVWTSHAHVGYTVLGYQPEKNGKTRQRFDHDALVFFRATVSCMQFHYPCIMLFASSQIRLPVSSISVLFFTLLASELCGASN